MSDVLVIHNEKYLKASAAGELVQYSSDYVTKLARDKKIKATRIKNQWFVEIDSLKLFSLNAEAEKRSRKERLREERIRERSEILKDAHRTVLVSGVDSSVRFALGQTVAIVVCVLLVFNLVWFSVENRVNTKALAAGVGDIGAMLEEVVVEPIPDFVSQVASFAFIEVVHRKTEVTVDPASDEFDQSTSDTENFQGIIVLDEETLTAEDIARIQESFSDEVKVEYDGEDTGVITPVFKERNGEEYRFLLVPVNPTNE